MGRHLFLLRRFPQSDLRVIVALLHEIVVCPHHLLHSVSFRFRYPQFAGNSLASCGELEAGMTVLRHTAMCNAWQPIASLACALWVASCMSILAPEVASS